MGVWPKIMEFATTATARPDILDRTYNSFCSKLQGIDYKNSTLYINIDPVPEHGNINATLEIAKKYFGNVIYNIPEEPNFTKAFKWCWSQVKNDYFFHLQDDWVLKRKVHLSELLKRIYLKEDFMKRPNTFVSVNLRAYNSIKDNRICLSPALCNSFWARDMSSRMVDQYNPERQIRPKSSQNEMKGIGHPYCIAFHYPDSSIIKDIGREWMLKNGVRRRKGIRFNSWANKSKYGSHYEVSESEIIKYKNYKA